jgi:phosphomannomutase
MALLLVEVMAWHKKSLGQLVAQLHEEFGEHHYGRLDLELKPGQKERAIAHFSDAKMTRLLEWSVTRREDFDGIKLYVDKLGWVMLRASGTEPMLRVYSETRNPAATRKILEETRSIVQRL